MPSDIMKISIVLLSMLLGSSCQDHPMGNEVSVENLSCEYRVNPLGIDRTLPRLTWTLHSSQRGQKQTAYQILVSSSEDQLKRDRGDIWDSGQVFSEQSVLVAYDGRPLLSGELCYWKVRVWDQDENPSPWSQTAYWSMGLLSEEDWKAQWISCRDSSTSPQFRQSFTLDKKPQTALLSLASLGYFELFVNGKKVGNEVLAPAVSNYEKRSYYQTFDLSAYLSKGLNHLGIWMGSGWYSPGLPGVVHHSPVVRAQLSLSFADSNQLIVTDPSWECKSSNRQLLGSWRWGDFGGELVDALKADEDWWNTNQSVEGWSSAVTVEVADAICTAQPCEGNAVFRRIHPESAEILEGGLVMIDFGTNLTGQMEVQLSNLHAGDTVVFYYADKDARNSGFIGHNQLMYRGFSTLGQYDQFISAGEARELFSNKFNYHAFRYLLIEGLSYLPDIEDLVALPVETAVAERGAFVCSNELYNQIHEMVKWTYRCLNLGGQTVDCPHRERLGYGDGQTIMDLGLYNFDAAALYGKWSQNWWDEQRPDGFVPFTAPCPHSTGGGPAWGAMSIVVPWKSYHFSGDIDLLKEGYPYMKKYMEYLNNHCKDDLLQDIFPGEKWPNLGDWVPPRRGMDQQDWVDDHSRRFFNNCYRVYLLGMMEDVALVLGMHEDHEAFKKMKEIAQKRVHETWFNEADSTYANGEQPYLIFPLKTGITPDSLKGAVFEKFVTTLTIEDQGHLNTGMIGTQIMTDYLQEIGRNDLVDLYVNKTTYPGWGYMIACGATTCWEQWNGNFSQIHSCFPYIGGWFYKGLAGIQRDPADPGFKNVILRPGLVNSVGWVRCHFVSPYGKIESNWKIEGGLLTWDIVVPPNSTATVFIPGTAIQESGLEAGSVSDMTFLRQEKDQGVYQLVSGRYCLVSTLQH